MIVGLIDSSHDGHVVQLAVYEGGKFSFVVVSKARAVLLPVIPDKLIQLRDLLFPQGAR